MPATLEYNKFGTKMVPDTEIKDMKNTPVDVDIEQLRKFLESNGVDVRNLHKNIKKVDPSLETQEEIEELRAYAIELIARESNSEKNPSLSLVYKNKVLSKTIHNTLK